MSTRLLPLALLTLLATAACAASWQDDFTKPRRYERWGTDCWTLGGGKAAFTAGGGDCYLIVLGAQSGQLKVEADLTLSARAGGGWPLAGVAAYADRTNHWRLLLVESPDGDRYFELVEMYMGEHQAQSGGRTPRARLDATTSGSLKSWQYGRTYHLTLDLTGAAITGTVTDPQSGEQWQRSYSLGSAIAVRAGRAALMADGMNGAFTALQSTASTVSATGTIKLQRGPAGAVAIIPDQAGRLAPRLAALLGPAGYGVTVILWEELDKTLPWEELDALIIADARTLPVAARDQLLTATQSAGKVICLGAPALSKLLMKSPEGWLPEAQWLDAYSSRLPRVPVAITPEQWTRATNSPADTGSLKPDPASGATAWKIESELKGWDTWRADFPTSPFDDRHQYLSLEVKGDATTSQLAVECTEEDGSRWIAVVEVTPQWQTQLLQPRDFVYWTDSKSKGRGGEGDRLQPDQVRALTFGLAMSHTHAVRPGPHTYWLRNVSVADGSSLPQPNFALPNLEALCPSYKLYPVNEVSKLRPAAEQDVAAAAEFAWSQPGYAPVWRERGRGIHRRRPWRWVPLLTALDARGQDRGAMVSLLIGDGVCPGAMWANFAFADPAAALDPKVAPTLLACVQAMSRGTFLLEGGAELFSYKPGEKATIGGSVVNLSRKPQTLILRASIGDGLAPLAEETKLKLTPGEVAEKVWSWTPTFRGQTTYEIRTTLLDEQGQVLDHIIQPVDQTRVKPAPPDEYVKVEGSNFTLAGKPWFFNGVNYWPNRIGGYPHLGQAQRASYDPEIIERDLTHLQALGINALSGVQALMPADPTDPNAFRDQLDFLDRCDRHGMKVFFFLPMGRPYYGGSFEKIRDYLTRAGLKDHPAIMCWELAWEPIDVNWQGRLDYLKEPWNRWIVERYGSLESACRDWGFTPKIENGKAALPSVEQCRTHGEWDRYGAAFRRAHSDIICAGYRDIAEPLRQWDPRHLVSFRGGACGIPDGPNFAHIHGTAAPKHMDFLNPEGYNLQPNGNGSLTEPDNLRKGGLVTLYYRFTSREKPIVWMEFGYTVNGFNTRWQPELVAIKPEELRRQEQELGNFYSMILESGARGAAPWWWPGGFRLGEDSDFGVVEPDGSERPACRIMRDAVAKFPQVRHLPPTDVLLLDLEKQYPEAWATFAPQYLSLVKAGKVVGLRTSGTGTNSETCALTTVGGGEYNGHNPPLYLNAEFNSLELKIGDGPWQAVTTGQSREAPVGAKVLCRANVGNLGEATWLAPQAGEQQGRVYLAGRQEYGLPFTAPLAADTAYLKDATVPPFTLIESVRQGAQSISFEMSSQGRAYFGERRTVVLTGK